MARRFVAAAAALAVLGACEPAPSSAPTAQLSPIETIALGSLSDADAAMRSGKATSADLVQVYLDRIAAMNAEGPRLNAVIMVSPTALDDAKARDAERATQQGGSALYGAAILIKDNIETADMPTTAGSLALKDNDTKRDAPVVAKLRAAGAVILGKANLSEWANFRDDGSMSGWSAVGGQVRNPFALDRSACGSSSGSGAAVAAGLAAAAIGTETDGSIVCPAAINGLVGLKPTVGLVSRTHIVPISASQDTAGPMTRTVRDAALILNAIAGADPLDPATKEADTRKTDYAAGLKDDALKGKKIGVARFLTGYHPATDAVFEEALKALRAAGAEVIEITDKPKLDGLGEAELQVLLSEFKAGLNAYLATTPATVKTRTLADVIAFNKAEARELALFGQRTFEKAEATAGLSDPAYVKAAADAKAISTGLLDGYFKQFDAVVAPTYSPAWPIDPVLGDHFIGGSSQLPAVSGYPHLTVPMGEVQGLPVGLSFFGPAWSEAQLLGFGYAYERLAPPRSAPTFRTSITSDAQAPASAPGR